MEYDLEDKKNIIYLKNQLLNATLNHLMSIYTEDEYDYVFFLDTLNITLDFEPTFFLIDASIFEKVERVLESRRWQYKDEQIREIINEIILNMNQIKNLSPEAKKARISAYCQWQEDIRQINFISHSDFLSSLAYDALLMDKLYRRDLSDVNAAYFIASTNYLAKNLPEFYQADPKRIDITLERLDKHAKKRWFWNYPERAFAKEAINNIQKVKVKEEY